MQFLLLTLHHRKAYFRTRHFFTLINQFRNNLQKNKNQPITQYDLKEIVLKFSSKDFPHFVSNGFAAIRFLMGYEKDVMHGLNVEAGYAISSVSQHF